MIHCPHLWITDWSYREKSNFEMHRLIPRDKNNIHSTYHKCKMCPWFSHFSPWICCHFQHALSFFRFGLVSILMLALGKNRPPPSALAENQFFAFFPGNKAENCSHTFVTEKGRKIYHIPPSIFFDLPSPQFFDPPLIFWTPPPPPKKRWTPKTWWLLGDYLVTTWWLLGDHLVTTWWPLGDYFVTTW